MRYDELIATIERNDVAPVPAGSWLRFKPRFFQTKAHDTGSHGKIRIGRMAGHLVAVERVDEEMKAIRRFADVAEASDFVKKRLAQYDRYWDG